MCLRKQERSDVIRMGAVMDPGLTDAEERSSAEGLSVQMPPRRSAAAGHLPAISVLHHYEISKAEGTPPV